jgi:putative transposase
MPSTHSALYFHVIFATKNREPLIDAQWEDRLFAFIGGIVRNADGKLLAAGGAADHVHLLLCLSPSHFIPDLMRDLKRDSSKWVNNEIGVRTFAWQEGYGIFSVSVSAIDSVTGYIRTQREHHKTTSFMDEYVAFLRKHGVNYDERYL